MSQLPYIKKGWFYGLVFWTTLFLAEGLYVAYSEPGVPFWTAPFNLGVGAPIGLVCAFSIALALAGWASYIPREEGPGAMLLRLFWRDDVERLARRSAWALSVAGLGAVFAAISLFAYVRIGLAIATPILAGLLLLLIQLTGLVAAAGMAAWTAQILTRVLTGIAGLGRGASFLVRPATVAALGALGFIVAGGVAWRLFPEVLEVLPWSFAVGPAAGLLVTATAIGLLEKRPAPRRLINHALSAAVVCAALFTLFLPMRFEEARLVFVSQSSIVSAWYDVIHPRLDFDEDGSIFFYAGGDCAPFDPDRGPHQQEIIGDGIDQNCSGFDLVVDPAEFHRGKKAHPRPKGVARRPNIVLITTDALSFPNTTVGGYARDTTPNLADWAERATVFESAFSTSTSTRFAMSGLVASMYNSQVPMKNKRRHPYDYQDGVQTFGTVFQKAGYQTVFIPSHPYFVRWKGFQAGFDEIDTRTYRENEDSIHKSPELTASALRYLDEHDPDDGPLFLWVHYYDHHAPYVVPEGGKVFGKKGRRQDRFDSELHFADQHWGELLEAVEEKWDPDEYLMIFSADHGEAFDENHPRHPHGYSIFTRPLHVPLIIQGPTERGVRVDGLTGHLDVLPTLANIIGVKPRKEWQGESLVPVLFDGRPIEKTVMYSLHYVPEAIKRDEDGFQMWGVRTNEFYFIENHRRNERRLVRWREDPLDRPDLSTKLTDTYEIYRYMAAEQVKWWRENEKALSP
ncbi:MAG: sulfatase-like hydrolase/transferase [Bradymonadaceae bacterium]